MRWLLTENIPGPDRFRAGIYQTCKIVLQPILHREALPNSYKASITLIPNVGKDTTKRENDRPIFLVCMDPVLVD